MRSLAPAPLSCRENGAKVIGVESPIPGRHGMAEGHARHRHHVSRSAMATIILAQAWSRQRGHVDPHLRGRGEDLRSVPSRPRHQRYLSKMSCSLRHGRDHTILSTQSFVYLQEHWIDRRGLSATSDPVAISDRRARSSALHHGYASGRQRQCRHVPRSFVGQ